MSLQRRYFAQQADCLTVGLTEFDAEHIKCEHRLFGGSSGPTISILAVATARQMKWQISELKAICSFAFYRDNGVPCRNLMILLSEMRLTALLERNYSLVVNRDAD